MNDHEHDAIRRLVRAGFGPPPDVPLSRDLWPDVVQRIRQRRTLARADLALIGMLVGSALVFPQHAILLLWCL